MTERVSYDPRNRAYWRRMVRFHPSAHGRHLAAANAARRAGDRREAARCLREASISRNLLAISLDCFAIIRGLDHA